MATCTLLNTVFKGGLCRVSLTDNNILHVISEWCLRWEKKLRLCVQRRCRSRAPAGWSLFTCMKSMEEHEHLEQRSESRYLYIPMMPSVPPPPGPVEAAAAPAAPGSRRSSPRSLRSRRTWETCPSTRCKVTSTSSSKSSTCAAFDWSEIKRRTSSKVRGRGAFYVSENRLRLTVCLSYRVLLRGVWRCGISKRSSDLRRSCEWCFGKPACC